MQQLIQTDERKTVYPAFNKIFLAMTYQNLGRSEEAKKTLEDATAWFEKYGQDKLEKGEVQNEPLSWQLRLELQFLFREARELLDKRPE